MKERWVPQCKATYEVGSNHKTSLVLMNRSFDWLAIIGMMERISTTLLGLVFADLFAD